MDGRSSRSLDKTGDEAQRERRRDDAGAKDAELAALKALNSVIAGACRAISLKNILFPALEVCCGPQGVFKDAGGGGKVVSAGVVVLDDDGTGLKLLACTNGADVSVCETASIAGECACVSAIHSSKAVHLPDTAAEPARCPLHNDEGASAHAHLTVPMISGGRPVGAIFFKLHPAGYYPTNDRTEAAESIGCFIAPHIENALRYEKMMRSTRRDGLTNLYSHREFERYLKLELTKASRFSKKLSVLLMVIDGYSDIVEKHGQVRMEKFVTEIGRVIRKNVRHIDVAARYSASEFALVLTDSSRATAALAAERLRAEVEADSCLGGGQGLAVTLSIGVAAYPADAKTFAGLVEAADTALRAAEDGGRNRVCEFAGLRPAPERECPPGTAAGADG